MNLSIKLVMGGLPLAIIAERRKQIMVKEAAVAAINAAGPLVQRELTRNTPVGATGKARQSVFFEPAGVGLFGFGTPTGFVGYGLPASQYIGHADQGTRPHWPPIAPLQLWANRVLGNPGLAFPIARKISREGTKAQKFVERTREMVHPRAIRIMRRVAMERLREIGR